MTLPVRLKGEIALRRGTEVVSDLFSVLGDLRETRLTAAIAYLISKAPSIFGPLFLDRRTSINEIRIEESKDSRRYDIVIRTPRKLVVVEAKVGYMQAPAQVRRYIRGLIRNEAEKKIVLYLLDRGGERLQTEIDEIRQKFPKCKVTAKTWTEVARTIERGCRSKKLQKAHPEVIVIGHELIKHLKENQMAASQTKEVYIRQLSGDSLELFFRYHLYKCQTKFAKSALQHLYFAPLFTAKAPKDFARQSMLPIDKGLSYIARIQDGRVVRRNQVVEYLKSLDHSIAKKAAAEVLRETKSKEFLLLVLGEPFQLFQTPISTRKLGVKGMLAQKTMTFEELLCASRTSA